MLSSFKNNNFFSKIKSLLSLLKRKFFECKSKFRFWNEINDQNLDYLFKINNIDFKFNYTNDLSQYNRLFEIKKRNLAYILFYFDKLNLIEKSFLFSNKDCFLIRKDLFNNNLNKLLLSIFLNSNSSIYVFNSKNDKNIKTINLMKYFKLSIFQKILSNKKNIRKKISTLLINIERRSKDYGYKFANFIDTYKVILKNINILRIGDCEMQIMIGNDGEYQKYNDNLKRELICSYNHFFKKNAIALNKKSFFKSSIVNDRNNWQDINMEINNDFIKKDLKIVYDANFWGINPYIIYTKNWNYLDKPMSFYQNETIYSIYSNDFYKKTKIGIEALNSYNIFFKDLFFSIFKNKNIIFISNISNEKFLNEDFFKNTRKSIFIETPERDAYSVKDKVIFNIEKNIDNKNLKNNIVVISCGAFGKVLSLFLDKKGISFIDIGNFINYYYYYNDKLTINNIQDIHNSTKMISLKNRKYKE